METIRLIVVDPSKDTSKPEAFRITSISEYTLKNILAHVENRPLELILASTSERKKHAEVKLKRSIKEFNNEIKSLQEDKHLRKTCKKLIESYQQQLEFLDDQEDQEYDDEEDEEEEELNLDELEQFIKKLEKVLKFKKS